MRILRKRIHYQKGQGFLQVMPIDEDDFWHLYNIIQIGDIIKTSTFRKVVKESQTGSKSSDKKRFTIVLKVCEINYWAENYLLLSIKGQNCKESQYLSLGQFHTVEFDYNLPITIYKENWDQFHYKILKEIDSKNTSSDVGAIIMEEGVAHICYISASTTLLKQKIEKNISKKRFGGEQREKSLKEFYNMCLMGLEQEKILEKVKCMILASPGYVKDDFLKYMKEQTGGDEKYKSIEKNMNKIISVKSSNGYLNSLMEVLCDQGIQNKLSDTKAMGEIKILNKFFDTLKQDSSKVAYGVKDVTFASENNAISHLLISDKLQRTRDLKKRKSYIELMNKVQQGGGQCYVFSSLHPSGQQLNHFSGVCAILYFGIEYNYEAVDDDEEEDNNQMVQQEEQKQNLNVLNDFDEFDDDQFM